MTNTTLLPAHPRRRRHRFTYLRLVDGAVDVGGVKAIDLWWMACAGAEELVQGAPMAPALAELFHAHLVDGSRWLTWRGDLAESTEMRRAFSGLYGRIVARALLVHRLGLTDLVSLERNVTPYGALVVKRNSTVVFGQTQYEVGDAPDWIATDPRTRRPVLCEAKGLLGGSVDTFRTGKPKCISTGKAQFGRVKVYYGSSVAATRNWVVANLWSTERRDRTPMSLMYDPPGEGDDIPDEAWPQVEAAARGAWLESVLNGLGVTRNEGEAPDAGTGFALTVEVPAPDPIETLRAVADQDDSDRSDESGPLLPDERHSTLGHGGRYLMALVTRAGMVFIRSPMELAYARLRIAEERDSGRSSLLVGVATDAQWRRGDVGGSEWISSAGIVRHDGFAVFDADRITVVADTD